jgi:RNA polymerase sigma-70 factor, ECF subfamily
MTVGMTHLTSGDLRSFYDGHYGRVVGVVALVTGSRAAAEDAVHEALARAWERGGIDHLDRWVLTVALNLARNRWRKVRREVPAGDTARRDDGCEPDDGRLVDLRRAVRALPARQREVVALHYLLDLPVAEVARLLGLSEGGVKHALFRARRSLAEALAVEEAP